VRYQQSFRDNEIDEQILPNLTAEDLKEIGVGPVGHRRKMLEAITALSGGFVAKYMGDDVLAYCGYPEAHEYDAERAVRVCRSAGTGNRRGLSPAASRPATTARTDFDSKMAGNLANVGSEMTVK
jgi:class 3 adenylate cyclase